MDGHLVQQDATPHVGERDKREDHQRSDEQALGPCLQNELLRARRLRAHFTARHDAGDGTHEDGRFFEDAGAACRGSAEGDVTWRKAQYPHSTLLPWQAERQEEGTTCEVRGQDTKEYEGERATGRSRVLRHLLRMSP